MLFDDPLFGLFAYGGEVVGNRETIAVVPRDGVRQRFSAVLGARRLHLELDRDGFAEAKAVELTTGLDHLRFTVENRGASADTTVLRAEGLPQGTYAVSVNSEGQTARSVSSGAPVIIPIQVSSTPATLVEIRRTQNLR